ncbi:hypothetical protein EKD04_002485 [Chloroflexales bacterium ZM16-3]|nr:hypothetical protein [Chloroflexales bacterium ZM16-3]
MKTVDQHIYDVALERLRRAAHLPSLLAAMLLGLLLIQPTLCIVHCATATHADAAADASGSQSHLICSLSDSQSAQSTHILVPAFWPSLPSAALSTLVPVALLLALPLLAIAGLCSILWAPPIPPPRAITAYC